MSDKPSPHIELLLLCGKVRDNALTAKDAARLDALLQASDQAKALFVQYMSIASLLESRGTSERKTGQASDELIDASPTINHDVLAELLELERQAEPIEVVLKPQTKTPKADQLSWSEVASAAAYLLNRPKVWGSLAADL